MVKKRKPFQGIVNIIRFNWHYFVVTFILILSLLVISNYMNPVVSDILRVVSFLISLSIFISLLVSLYVYDLSGFYNFEWIDSDDTKIAIININAGFDETSKILKSKYKNATFSVLDFYNPSKHTEVSIKRARKKYPSYPNTIEIDSSKIEIESNSIDKIFIILSAHEIRNKKERINFFKELKRIIKPSGQIIVIEHLRDFSNFIAYTIGSFHFYSKSSWLDTFSKSKLMMLSENKITPFISIFTLKKNGNTL